MSEVDLDGDRARVRSEETNLGDAIADAMLWKTSSQGARVALHNGGGVRASVPQGPVTMGQILEVLPFGNEISLVALTGRQLLDALENGVSQVEAGAGRFPQVSGLRFSFDPAAAAGERVRLVGVWDPKAGAYRALLPEETLIVATNDFLAGGGDGYAAFAAGADRYDTGWLLSDVLAEYVGEHSPLRVEVDGRIRAVGSGPAGG
jgi:5'-nucleotidase